MYCIWWVLYTVHRRYERTGRRVYSVWRVMICVLCHAWFLLSLQLQLQRVWMVLHWPLHNPCHGGCASQHSTVKDKRSGPVLWHVIEDGQSLCRTAKCCCVLYHMILALRLQESPYSFSPFLHRILLFSLIRTVLLNISISRRCGAWVLPIVLSCSNLSVLNIVLRCIALRCMLYCMVMRLRCCTVLYCTVLYCTVLYCTNRVFSELKTLPVV